MRPNDQTSGLIVLYLGNSGPTVATNVRVTFDPPLDFPQAGANRVSEAVTRLAGGISSLPPGRQMQWNMGVAHQQVPASNMAGYRVIINADSAFGKMPEQTYVINLQDIRHNLSSPPGTLHGVTQAIEKLTNKVDRVGEVLIAVQPEETTA